MQIRLVVPIAILLLAISGWALWQSLISRATALETDVLTTAASITSSSGGATAVVLGDFSASIQGPSSALWSMSIALILIGVLIVQYRYRHY